VIQTALLERVGQLDNVDLLCPATLALASVLEPEVHLRFRMDESCAPACWWAPTAPIPGSGIGPRWMWVGWGYGQKAVVTPVRTEKPHQETAWQRFLPTGPLAFLPLHDGRCSIVWSTTPEQAEQLLQLDEAAFAWALGKAFEHRLGDIVDVGPRGAFPLRLQHAQDYVKPHIALVGDAAHVIHPLAGQGVNLGLLDAAALAEVLLEAAAAGRDIGAFKVLRRYERWRKGENLLMLGVMDASSGYSGVPYRRCGGCAIWV